MEILRKNCLAIITWLFLFTPQVNYNHGQKSWDTFAFLGHSPIHTGPTPLPSPHKQCWTHVSKIFSDFQLCIGWGEGELQENFEKGCTVLRGNRQMTENMNIAVLSQGLCPGLQFESESPLYNGPKQARRGCCLTVQRPAEFKVLFSPNFYDILWIDQVL